MYHRTLTSARARTVCLTAVACLLLSPAPGALARAATPSQSTIAGRLVTGVLHARSARSRTAATLAMMRALHISVVTPSGTPSVVAPEQNAARLFELYTDELGPLATAAQRAPSLTIDDLGAGLARMGLARDKQNDAIPSALLRTALIASVKTAVAHPKQASSLLPLIVRQLGRDHHPAYDLARNPTLAQIHLDGLQSWLITADTGISALRAIVGGSAADLGTASTAHTASAAGDACQKLTDASDALDKKLEKAYGGKIQKWIGGYAVGKIGDRIKQELRDNHIPAEWTVALDDLADRANLVKAILSGIHASLLAASISVHTLNNAQSVPDVHWYHVPGEAGHQTTFAVMVEMLDDYGDTVQKCGDLAGFTFPPKGGIAKVPVAWEQVQAKLTPDMGKLSCLIQAACVTLTDASGVARVTFTPNTEVFPGTGLQQDSSGVLNGLAAYQSAVGAGVAGQIAQVLTPKYAGLRWRVTYHKEPKLTLHITDTYTQQYTNQTINQFETTGTGQIDYALSASAPLTRVTNNYGTSTTTGPNLWIGDAPINWDTFSYHDDNRHYGVASDCDGGNSTLSEDGSSPVAGELEVDSLSFDPRTGLAGLAVTFHDSVLPSFTLHDTYTADKSVPNPCSDFTQDNPSNEAFPLQVITGNPGVTTVSYGSGSSGGTTGNTVRVTGWLPGPGYTSGSGVYAYRDFPNNSTDGQGEPSTADSRLEIIASPGQ